MSGHRLQAEADAAMARYADTCAMGGTPEELASSWAQANAALDTFLKHKHAEDKTRSKRDTIELDAA